MTKKYNPFKPNNPVFTGMFAGRGKEIKRIDDLLFQAKMQNPTHILFHGERGIGKTSLLLVANHFSKGTLKWEEEKYNFLTIQLSISPQTTLLDFVKRINLSIKRECQKQNLQLRSLK